MRTAEVAIEKSLATLLHEAHRDGEKTEECKVNVEDIILEVIIVPCFQPSKPSFYFTIP